MKQELESEICKDLYWPERRKNTVFMFLVFATRKSSEMEVPAVHVGEASQDGGSDEEDDRSFPLLLEQTD